MFLIGIGNAVRGFEHAFYFWRCGPGFLCFAMFPPPAGWHRDKLILDSTVPVPDLVANANHVPGNAAHFRAIP
jgi:hypothetical protein